MTWYGFQPNNPNCAINSRSVKVKTRFLHKQYALYETYAYAYGCLEEKFLLTAHDWSWHIIQHLMTFLKGVAKFITSSRLLTSIRVMDRLAVYIAAANLAPREAEIRVLVAQGAQDVRAIMTSPWSAEEVRRDMERESKTRPATRDRQVTGIMWYLFALAVERNQGFVTGAFVCLDPHGRLFAYFQGVGTARISSHLKRHSAPGCTGGVDLHADDVLPPLPHGHRHVLFIAINHDKRRGRCLFLKPERYGVGGVRNFIRHAAHYIRSLARRRRFGGNEGVGMRKERIPDRAVHDFREAVAHLPDGPSAIAKVGRHAEGDGIGGMHDYLIKKLADAKLPESARAPLATMLYRLESEYDFAALRFGNEVFLDLATDLAGPLPEALEVHGPSLSLLWQRPFPQWATQYEL
ncbi:hypothetical protein FQN54_000936 [Arachnomyces sp. PD_36]|nr:hypothetical protein FQN54_000936 [Arachnomyces sp. PD_36]